MATTYVWNGPEVPIPGHSSFFSFPFSPLISRTKQIFHKSIERWENIAFSPSANCQIQTFLRQAPFFLPLMSSLFGRVRLFSELGVLKMAACRIFSVQLHTWMNRVSKSNALGPIGKENRCYWSIKLSIIHGCKPMIVSVWRSYVWMR